MHIQPYLFFNGRCEEAVEFYKRVLNAEVIAMLRFSDNPAPEGQCMVPPGSEDKVMHMCMRIGDSTVMASDGRCTGEPGFQGFALTLTLSDAATTKRLFSALGEGGQVQVPLEETFFSPCFGMVADRFGVLWTVLTARDAEA